MKKNENVEVLCEMTEEEPVKKENVFKRAWTWVKGHKGLFIGVATTTLVCIVVTIMVKNHGKIDDTNLVDAVKEAIDLGADTVVDGAVNVAEEII